MPFKKGQSGNPGGSTSGKQRISERIQKIIERHTVEEIRDLIEDPAAEKKLCAVDFMIIKRAREAMGDSGDSQRACDFIFDRAYGKAMQEVRAEINENKKLTVEILTVSKEEQALMIAKNDSQVIEGEAVEIEKLNQS